MSDSSNRDISFVVSTSQMTSFYKAVSAPTWMLN